MVTIDFWIPGHGVITLPRLQTVPRIGERVIYLAVSYKVDQVTHQIDTGQIAVSLRST